MSSFLSKWSWQTASTIAISAAVTATGTLILVHLYFRHNLKLANHSDNVDLNDHSYSPPLPDQISRLLK
jgi:hypothetical protein